MLIERSLTYARQNEKKDHLRTWRLSRRMDCHHGTDSCVYHPVQAGFSSVLYRATVGAMHAVVVQLF